MHRCLCRVVMTLAATTIATIGLAGAADAASRTVHDKTGDGSGGIDVTSLTIHAAKRAVTMSMHVKHLPRAGAFDFNLSDPYGDGDGGYVRLTRSHGHLRTVFKTYDDLGDETRRACRVRRSWNEGRNEVSVSFSFSCLKAEGTFNSWYYSGTGNPHGYYGGDSTKYVKVRRG